MLTNRSRSHQHDTLHSLLPSSSPPKPKLPQLDNKLEHVISPTRKKVRSAFDSSQTEFKLKPHNSRLEPLKKSALLTHSINTKAGCYGLQPKINQDAGFYEQFGNGVQLMGVADGHGVNGHFVSGFIKRELAITTNRLLAKESSITESSLAKILRRAISLTNNMLLSSQINTDLSGSTLVAALRYKDSLVTANVGDSRAVLLRLDESWLIEQLTNDQKPSREDEKERILKAGGRVDYQKDQDGNNIGPLRVWMKNIWMPGLAMTRCMGDKFGLKAGTTADPEITITHLTIHDKYIILASDGIWEYMSNQQVLQAAKSGLLRSNPESAGERVVRHAVSTWKRMSQSRDDITVVIVCLNVI